MSNQSHTGIPRGPLDAAAWDERYRANDTPWDRGEPAPGLVDFLDQQVYTPGAALVPGCGGGHDCLALAQHGFDVTGLDLSAEALARAAAKAPSRTTLIQGDFLALPPALHQRFDWLVEHTCFCAIHPGLRDQYVRSVRQALKPGGHFLGIFFVIKVEQGPPFGATRDELCSRFGAHFDLRMEHTPRSWPNRTGEEWLTWWQLRPGAHLSAA